MPGAQSDPYALNDRLSTDDWHHKPAGLIDITVDTGKDGAGQGQTRPASVPLTPWRGVCPSVAWRAGRGRREPPARRAGPPLPLPVPAGACRRSRAGAGTGARQSRGHRPRRDRHLGLHRRREGGALGHLGLNHHRRLDRHRGHRRAGQHARRGRGGGPGHNRRPRGLQGLRGLRRPRWDGRDGSACSAGGGRRGEGGGRRRRRPPPPSPPVEVGVRVAPGTGASVGVGVPGPGCWTVPAQACPSAPGRGCWRGPAWARASPARPSRWAWDSAGAVGVDVVGVPGGGPGGVGVRVGPPG